MTFIFAIMATLAFTCHGKSLLQDGSTPLSIGNSLLNGLLKGYPAGIFQCDGDTANGTVTFSRDSMYFRTQEVHKVSLDLLVLGCRIKVGDMPYILVTGQPVGGNIVVDYDHTTLVEQVEKCGQPRAIIPEDLANMLYFSAPPQTVEFIPLTGMWGVSCAQFS